MIYESKIFFKITASWHLFTDINFSILTMLLLMTKIISNIIHHQENGWYPMLMTVFDIMIIYMYVCIYILMYENNTYSKLYWFNSNLK